MLKLETPWDDDEDEDDDLPHRPEDDDDSPPDGDDPIDDDDDDYCSPMTATVIVTETSVCSTIWIGNSPTCLSGP